MIKDILFQKSLNLNTTEKKKQIISSFLLILILICCFATNAFAKDVTLEWDANDDADYYVVYWGYSSGDYTEYSDNIDATETEYTAVDILASENTYFAVKAFNSCGNSSEFSEEMISEATDAKGTTDNNSDDTGTSDIDDTPIFADSSKGGGCFIATTDHLSGRVSGNTFYMLIFRMIFCFGIMKFLRMFIKVG